MPTQLTAQRLLISGRVQGVGFRPHVYRQASALQLVGWVRNRLGLVEIHVQGPDAAITEFIQRLIHQAPSMASPKLHDYRNVTVLPLHDFTILDSLACGARDEGNTTIPPTMSAGDTPITSTPSTSSGPSTSLRTGEVHPTDVGTPYASIPLDVAVCQACLAEVYDPANRRYRYPFINCTQCGPRYTIIQTLPYDRATTTMAAFPLCADCTQEYHDPKDRRFHAEPLACAMCGPSLSFRCLRQAKASDSEQHFCLESADLVHIVENTHQPEMWGHPTPQPEMWGHPTPQPEMRGHPTPQPEMWGHPTSPLQLNNDAALAACIVALKDGLVIAIRGLGGYHLCCAAEQAKAIAHLRRYKPRPHKPLAVMFPAPLMQPLAIVATQVHLSKMAAKLLLSPQQPIVLARRRAGCTVDPQVAPGLNEIGVLLPYTPLHHLLLHDFAAPLVVTSANISGEPIITESAEAETRLKHVAAGFLHHNRPITRPIDDSVYRSTGGSGKGSHLNARGRLRPLRLGRGHTPLELRLSANIHQPVLAVGGHNKNTIALAWEQRVVLSPHIGDLDSARSFALFTQSIADLQRLYGVKAKLVICDAHPNYASTHWAKDCGLPYQLIWHHHAHAAAVYGEAQGSGDWLVFTWDGLGYDANGNLVGGEALLGKPGSWRTFATIRSFAIVGGERASLEPWRSAAALIWECGLPALSVGHTPPIQTLFRCGDTPRPHGGGDGNPHIFNLPPQADLAMHAWQRGINSPRTTAIGRLFDAAAALTGLCQQASFDGQAPMLFEAAASSSVGNTCSLPVLALPLQQNAAGIWVSDWSPLLSMLQDASISIGKRAEQFHDSIAYMALQQARQARYIHGISQIGLAGGVWQNRLLVSKARLMLHRDGFNVTMPRLVPINDAGLSYGQVLEFCNMPWVSELVGS